MSIENSDTNTTTNDAAVEDTSLEAFETEFFSGKAPVEKPTEEVVEEESENDDSTTDETTEGESEEETNEETSEDEPKKETRAEKRIRELNAKYREAERRAEEAERRAEEAERGRTVDKSKEPTPVTTDDTAPAGAPHWDDEDSNGNKIYPLGQFDPKFNADLVRYTIQEENRVLEEKRAQTDAQQKAQEAEATAQAQWNEKLAPVQERYPDFTERGQELIDQFADLEPNYGKYLTDTLRAIDNGPEVLYYLANNLDLADEIVRKGATQATIALGRISAQLEKDASGNTPPTRTKVTNAPPPPPTARGTSAPKTKNLDDLDEFERAFFSR